MTLTILDVSEELMDALRKQAAAGGQTVEAYAGEVLRQEGSRCRCGAVLAAVKFAVVVHRQQR